MSKWGRVLACGAVLAAFAVVAATAGSAPARTHAHCPSRAQIARLPRWRAGGRLRADLDGDGRPDTVTVRFARMAEGRCAFYLRVATAGRAYTWRLGLLVGDLGKLQVNEPIRDWQFRIPAVEAIVDLGGHGNLIALGDNEGAANLFVDFVGFTNGRFRLIRMGLGLGGPMTAVTRASCVRGGPLRVWNVWNAWTKHDLNRWAFSIDTYRRRGRRIVAVAHRRRYGSYKQMWRAADQAGIPKYALVGCSLARSPEFG